MDGENPKRLGDLSLNLGETIGGILLPIAACIYTYYFDSPSERTAFRIVGSALLGAFGGNACWWMITSRRH